MTRRLIAALDDLLELAPDERRLVLLEQLDLINDAGRQLDRDERDTDLALSPDPQGIGVARQHESPSRCSMTCARRRNERWLRTWVAGSITGRTRLPIVLDAGSS